MDRRKFLSAIIPAATVGFCVPALAAEISPAAEAAIGLRCTKCFAPAHFHRISRTPIFEGRHVGYSAAPNALVISHYHEHWMTPRGEVRVNRWPSMDDSHMMAAIEGAMFAMYPREGDRL